MDITLNTANGLIIKTYRTIASSIITGEQEMNRYELVTPFLEE